MPFLLRISVILTEVRTSMPLLMRESFRESASSRSIRGISRSVASTMVTWLPKGAKAQASSQPMTPPPIMTSLSGISLRSRISVLVSTLGLSMPGMGMRVATEPPHRMMESAV